MTFVVLVDDQEMIRVPGEAADGEAGLEEVRRCRPHVCLMALRMPVMSGITATRRIVAEGLPTKVLC